MLHMYYIHNNKIDKKKYIYIYSKFCQVYQNRFQQNEQQKPELCNFFHCTTNV